MPGQIRHAGSWKQITPHIRVGSSWKQAREGWVKVNGVWRRWYVSATTFSFTGSQVTYTVPTGTTSITVDMAGAAGGGVSNTINSGGGRNGGRIQATLPVTPGQVLHLRVGGAGRGISANWPAEGGLIVFQWEGGWPGGGSNGNTQLSQGSAKNVVGSGGGYSGIFSSSTINQANALLIAGGGGGRGSYGVLGNPYVGQNATTTSGGAAGGAGQEPNSATAGSALQGGMGDANDNTFPGPYNGTGAGGGGGGYFGGGGGWGLNVSDWPPVTGAGGNGSSWAHASATNVTTTNEFQAGNGYITIFA